MLGHNIGIVISIGHNGLHVILKNRTGVVITPPRYRRFFNQQNEEKVTLSYFSGPFFRPTKITKGKVDRKILLAMPYTSTTDVAASQPTDASENLCSTSDYQTVNEISAEVRNMILKWEKANAAVKSWQEHAEYRTTMQVSAGVIGSDLQHPPQRYRRVSKRAHVG